MPSVITVSCITFIFHMHISWIEITYIFTVILFIFSSFAYSMEYFTTKLEKFMFPRKYFLQQSLKKISKALGTITNFNALKEIILNDIVTTLEIHGGAIVFVEKDGIQVITAGDIDEEDVKTSMENGVYKGDKYTAFEINRHEEYRSFLVVSGKKSNTHLGQEDRHWINLIVTYLSASLENVYLIRKLTLKMYELMANIPNEEATPEFVWLRKTMYDIQEKERIRIAMDLHDTTMQDLFLLKRRLYPILQRFPKMTDEYGQLTGILTHIDLINENLRQSCFELNPYVLQKTGLVGSIRKLVDVESSYSEFQVNFIADCTAQIELLEVERKKHLFRVIQELLNNAKKHSQAEHVTIRLEEENSSINLFYEDDGIGFDRQLKEMNRKNRIISGAGIGLDQMQGRVLLMNGEFYMDTERGKGVHIEIRIPFLEGISA
ncbi:sensor histidine kinase [Paenibacillus chitinolyticus]|uniref:sensor histidine kinase n=1 Tax=Paenibacillus chitinolyticus TaxID=79263 RepID=UPI00366D48FC